MKLLLPRASSPEITLLPSGLRLDGSTQLNPFLSTPEGSSSKLVLANAPYARYTLAAQYELDGEHVLVTVQFANDRISWVELSIAAAGAATWANWSAADEARKHARHAELVRKEYGQDPYSAPWGEVGAYDDPRAGGSNIVVRFS